MLNKYDKRVIKTEKCIRDAFMALLEEKEFSKITVSELARRAFIDRKTFYLHYENTNDLLEEFESELLTITMTETNKMKNFDVHEILYIFNQILDDNKKFFKNISSTGRNAFFLKRCEEIIKLMLRSQVGIEGKVDEVTLEYQLDFVSAGIVAGYMDWLVHEDTIPMSKLANILSELVEVNLKVIKSISE